MDQLEPQNNVKNVVKNIVKKQLPNGLEVYQNNEGETDFLYEEIFLKEMYFKNGITLADNSTVLDIGANIGMFTLFVNSKSKNCKVYAFEPLPPTYDILQLNTGSLPNVTAVNCGLSNTNKEALFAYFPTMSTDSVQIKYRENHEKDLRFGLLNHYKNDYPESKALNRFVDHVMSPKILNEQIFNCRLTTISDILRSYDLMDVDLLKIDVEKSEFEVLEGIFETNGFQVVIDYYSDLNIPIYYNVYATNQHVSMS